MSKGKLHAKSEHLQSAHKKIHDAGTTSKDDLDKKLGNLAHAAEKGSLRIFQEAIKPIAEALKSDLAGSVEKFCEAFAEGLLDIDRATSDADDSLKNSTTDVQRPRSGPGTGPTPTVAGDNVGKAKKPPMLGDWVDPSPLTGNPLDPGKKRKQP